MLINASALAFAANMISNVANYGTQVALGRMLGPADFGCYNAIMALLMLLAIPINSIGFIITRKVATFHQEEREDLIINYYHQSFKKILYLGMALIILTLSLQPFFQEFLHIENWRALILLGPIAMISLLQPFNMAFNQGVHDFRWVAANNAVNGPLRLVATVSAALLGFGVAGLMFGVMLAVFLSYIFSTIPCKNYRRHKKFNQSMPSDSNAWLEFVPVLISTTAYLIITQGDLILVKHLFSAHDAGLFAAAALFGKVVLYVPAAVVIGLVPMVAGKDDSTQRNVLFKSLCLTAVLSGSVAFILWWQPYWVLHTFFGAAFLPASALLKYFGLAMLPLAFIFIIKAYFIAKGANEFSYVLLAGAMGMILTIIYRSITPMDVLQWIFVWGSSVAVIGLVIEFFPLTKVFNYAKKSL